MAVLFILRKGKIFVPMCQIQLSSVLLGFSINRKNAHCTRIFNELYRCAASL